MVIENVLREFGVVVVDSKSPAFNYQNARHGFVTDFKPTAAQLTALKSVYSPLNVNTIFTVKERNESSVEELFTKQILHYIEVYGLGQPGLFDLIGTNGQAYTLNFVKGVSKAEFGEMVRKILYSNSPTKDVATIKEMVTTYSVALDVNKIQNNEFKMFLFDEKHDTFVDGDDAVRFIVFKATGETMLIKSKEVLEKINRNTVTIEFLQKHVVVLSQVFNRHKDIMMKLKGASNNNSPFAKVAAKFKVSNVNTVINKISRLSKKNHIPIVPAINKTFIEKAQAAGFDFAVLDKIGMRDKLKFLNVLRFRKADVGFDSFVIRNGKIHTKQNNRKYNMLRLGVIEQEVLKSLKKDLSGLNEGNVLLDSRVHYGLPTSRKQVIGKIPFGTTVELGERISAGMYWENDWGATDLDLSTMDLNGERVGWGQMSGYGKGDITYSGDVTYAGEGAMEFMTSENSTYALNINIFSGRSGAEAEIVVGTGSKDRWIEDVFLREKVSLNSKECVIGFVKDTKYIAFCGRTGNSRVSGSFSSMVQKASLSVWTVNELFDELGIKYSVEDDNTVAFEHDLSYNQFAFDKIEKLFGI